MYLPRSQQRKASHIDALTSMNRKIQESDRAFIIARYRRNPHAFDARSEASTHDVSLRTIYNTLSQAGIQMKRGRKPLISPDLPESPDTLQPLKSLIPVDCSNFLIPPVIPNTAIPPKPPESQMRSRRGPPIIRPKREIK